MPRYGKLSLVLVLLVTACHSAPDAKDTENTRMVADVRKAAAAEFLAVGKAGGK